MNKTGQGSELASIADIKKYLRAVRKTKGWTQAELAERMTVAQPRIAKIEASPGAVSLEQFLKLLEVLGVQLTGYSQPNPSRPGHDEISY